MKSVIVMLMICIGFAQIIKIETAYGDSTYVEEYYMNGKVKIKGYKVNNFKHGDWFFYTDKGKVDKIVRYKNGSKIKTLGGK